MHKNKRIAWIDIARFWGMFFIYLGHFGNTAGNAYNWVFSFHVPLFFFLSGCLENNNQRSFSENLKRKVMTILLPFYLFGLISIIYEAINSNSASSLKSGVHILLLGGTRNTIAHGQALWFLTCLFIIQITFSLLKHTLKRKWIILLLCLIANMASVFLITPSPIVTPHWYYNADSACYYLIFYCMGWILYSPINILLTETRITYRIIKYCLTTISLLYSAMLFFGRNLIAPLDTMQPLFHELYSLLLPFPSIWLVIIVSELFQPEWQKSIGRNSLYMCGSEYLIKNLVPQILTMLGLTICITTAIQTYLYSLVLLTLTNITLVPLEKTLLEKIQHLFCQHDI